MDGITVLKEFRKKNKTLPVLLLTARNEVEDKVLGLDSGADDYLGKTLFHKRTACADTGNVAAQR